LHPLESAALSRRTPKTDVGRRISGPMKLTKGAKSEMGPNSDVSAALSYPPEMVTVH
jgi:hypothetical protein